MLGTASQAPTAERSHGGYLLHWERETLLFDPGEGTQRQLALAGESVTRITRVCIGHFHGDHCLGLPGVVQHRALQLTRGPLRLHYPERGRPFVDHLLAGSEVDFDLALVHEPVDPDGPAREIRVGSLVLTARALDHTVPTVGWRLEQPASRHLLPERLEAAGISGAAVGVLERDGEVVVDGRRIGIDAVSELRPGPVFAIVMDTRRCVGAEQLADGADLLVCEATYLEPEADLAHAHGHLTAAGAARLARDCGVRRLVLSHYSERYPDTDAFAEEAGAVFPDVVAARDLTRVRFPTRQERLG